MALLRILLPSEGRVGDSDNNVWPLLRVIKLTYFDVEDLNSLCNLIAHAISLLKSTHPRWEEFRRRSHG
jgi:hypothetical protein